MRRRGLQRSARFRSMRRNCASSSSIRRATACSCFEPVCDRGGRRALQHGEGGGRGGQFLRVKLFVDRSAAELDQLRWELTDPATGVRLATSERILFSRFGDSGDWRTVALRPRGELRALVAVSSPSDLEGRGLPEVDVEGEVSRAREHLQGIEVAVAGKDEPLTLARLVEGLRGGVDILYLVCHGGLVGDGSVLYLQGHTGEIVATSGDEARAADPRACRAAAAGGAGLVRERRLRGGVRLEGRGRGAARSAGAAAGGGGRARGSCHAGPDHDADRGASSCQLSSPRCSRTARSTGRWR